jgi:hypothetical protein
MIEMFVGLIQLMAMLPFALCLIYAIGTRGRGE